MTGRPPKRVASKVVGVSFVPTYPDNVEALERMTATRLIRGEEYAEPIPAVLIRNPANEHDPNAVEVHVPSGGVGMLGHLRRVEAAVLAPHLDAGVIYQGEIVRVLVNRAALDRPGVAIRMTRIDKEPQPCSA